MELSTCFCGVNTALDEMQTNAGKETRASSSSGFLNAAKTSEPRVKSLRSGNLIFVLEKWRSFDLEI